MRHRYERQTLRGIDTPLRFDPEFQSDVDDPDAFGSQVTMNCNDAPANAIGPSARRNVSPAGRRFDVNEQWDQKYRPEPEVPELTDADINEALFRALWRS